MSTRRGGDDSHKSFHVERSVLWGLLHLPLAELAPPPPAPHVQIAVNLRRYGHKGMEEEGEEMKSMYYNPYSLALSLPPSLFPPSLPPSLPLPSLTAPLPPSLPACLLTINSC